MFRASPSPSSVAALRACALGVWLASSAACFSPSYRDCQVTCAEGGHCPAPLHCRQGFCRTAGAVEGCGQGDAAVDQEVNLPDAGDEGSDGSDSLDLVDADAASTDLPDLVDGGGDVVDAPDAVNADGVNANGANPDGANADGATEAASEVPGGPPSAIVATWFDTTTLMRPDLVSNVDDGVTPGDGSDLVLGAVVVGPLDALVLVASTPSSTDATAAWDTIVEAQLFPSAVSTRFHKGRETPILGVSTDGLSLTNRPDGTLAPISSGIHSLKLFANLRPAMFEPGVHFTLVGISGDSVIWGSSVEPYWGGPSINSVSISSDSLVADVVGPEFTKVRPDGAPDFAFEIDVTGPFDTLLLRAVVTCLDDCGSAEFVWDTIPEDQLFPPGLAPSSYQYGRDTWILAVSDASGAFINNNVDGSLPLLVGRFSGQVFASVAPADPKGLQYLFQLIGLIGDTKVFGPLLPFQL